MALQKSGQAVALLALACVVDRKLVLAGKVKNVYGNALQSCSSSGMAVTGVTHTGYCVEDGYNSGARYICIDVSDSNGAHYCYTTGEYNWCSEWMPCHDEDSDQSYGNNYGNNWNNYGNMYGYNNGYFCPVQSWCVDQWEFAYYMKQAGGCSSIQNIQCDAINFQAVKLFKNTTDETYEEALECIEKKCGVSFRRNSIVVNPTKHVKTASEKFLTWAGNHPELAGVVGAFFLVGIVICCVSCSYCCVRCVRKSQAERSEPLVAKEREGVLA